MRPAKSRGGQVLLHISGGLGQEPQELTIYLARNAKNVERALKGKEPELGQGEEESATADNVARLKAAN